MKTKINRFGLLVFLGISIIPAALKAKDSVGCSEWTTSSSSPSKEYNYKVSEVDNYYIVTIYKTTTLVYTLSQKYRMQDRFFIAWDQKKDMLWIYSGDTGLYYFEFTNGQWTQNTWIAGKSDASEIPDEMIKNIPIIKTVIKLK